MKNVREAADSWIFACMYDGRYDDGGAGDACGRCHPGPDCGQRSHSEALPDTQHVCRLPWQQQRGGDRQEPGALPGLPVTLCKCHGARPAAQVCSN